MEWFINQRKIRVFFSIFLASLVSLVLFYFMSTLIKGEEGLKKSIRDQVVIEFIRFKKETALNERKRAVPKPPKPKIPPRVPLKVSQIKPELQVNKALTIPPLDFSLKGDGPGIGGYGGSQNSSPIPLVRIQPPYPRKAALQKVEGFVDLIYDITHIGTVKRVKVIRSQPLGFFEKAAMRAVMKWKYKPKMEEGKPVEQNNVAVRLDFKLEDLDL